MLGAPELAAGPLSDSDLELLLDSASSVRLVPVSAVETYVPAEMLVEVPVLVGVKDSTSMSSL